ncbi:MAG: hypothetical protein OQJ96_10700 [Flavobacteriales bacterium]|nr:hypothetical protein [Flavobacteriales bacterium]MCW8914164.1 hypothetical protein [Flavobacteriales bacterium]MCW8938305.1 hypothetical protein [Flavobacteriales bacterium]MCW8940360.1 hypothetical protein [Flavobacteriales bacterium]MCW8969426.1 hypothetical protein [Flavobacteriales bacterium]
MRYLLFILLLNFTFITKGQEVIDSSETVMLEVQIFNEATLNPLNEAEISIIGTDGSKRIFFTDSIGIAYTPLNTQVTYSYTINKKDFSNKTDTISIIGNGIRNSYLRKYYLTEAFICFIELPKLLFHNNTTNLIALPNENDSFSLMVSIMNENPTLVVECIAYQSKKELANLSKKRAEKIINELVAKGIEKDRLVFKDGGIGENEKEEDNSYVVFKVVKTDYVSKTVKK